MTAPEATPPGPVATRIGRAALALAVVAAAAPAVANVYGPGWLVPVAGAAALAVLVDLVVRLALGRGHPAVLLAVHGVGLLLWTSVSVRPALDGTTAFGGATDGVARILTAVPPVDPRGPELAVAVLAAWVVAGLTAAVLARARVTLLGVVPVIAFFAGALVLGDPREALADGAPLALAVACGLVLVVGVRAVTAPTAPALAATSARPAAARVLRPVSAVAVALVAAVVGVAVGPSVPGLGERDRLDLRARIDPPVEVLLAESPLDLVPPRRAEASTTPRFTARVALPAGADGRLYWRLSVLDRVGPNGWVQPTAGYVRAGRSLGPPPSGSSGARGRATVDLQLGPAPAGLPLVPTIDRPLTVDPAGLAFEPRTAQLAVPTDRPRPERVRLDVSVPTYTSRVLTGSPAVQVAPPPDLPPAAVARARATVEATPNDFRRLSSLVDAVATTPALRLDVTQPGNTADATVARLLVPEEPAEPVEPDAEEPDAEEPDGDDPVEPTEPAVRSANAAQLAAAFALLARAEGFDVRLVVGYLTPVAGDRTAARRAELTVTDEQLTVWPEVRFEGLGWVPFRVQAPEGTGDQGGGAAPDDDEGTSVVDETVSQQTQPPPTEEAPDPGPAPAPAVDAAAGDGGPPWPAIGLVAVVLALAALAAWGPLARARRRRRRDRGDDDGRVLGAWAELVDRAAEAGLAVGTDHTRPDVVRVVSAALDGPDELAWLARTADRLAFAGAPVGEPVGERAWRVVADLAVRVRARRTRAQRVFDRIRPPRRLRPSAPAGHG